MTFKEVENTLGVICVIVWLCCLLVRYIKKCVKKEQENDKKAPINTVKKTVQNSPDRKFLNDRFPGLLEAFEEAHQGLSAPRDEVIYKYRIVGTASLQGVPEKSCYRVQLACGQFPDEGWQKFFPTGWDSMTSIGLYKGFIFKDVYYKYGNVETSGLDWILDHIVKVHPEWSTAGDSVFFDV